MATKHRLPDPQPDQDDTGEFEAGDVPAPTPEQPPADTAVGAGEFDAIGKTWDDTYTAATDNPAHPLRHLKGV